MGHQELQPGLRPLIQATTGAEGWEVKTTESQGKGSQKVPKGPVPLAPSIDWPARAGACKDAKANGCTRELPLSICKQVQNQQHVTLVSGLPQPRLGHQLKKKNPFLLGVVVHASSPSSQKAEADGLLNSRSAWST